MDILVATFVSVIQAALGVAGAVVSLKRRNERERVRFATFFVALSVIGICLTIWQAVLARQNNEESIKNQLGDAAHPPLLSIMSLPGTTWFVTVNSSDYPAYGTKIRLYDKEDRIVRSFDYPDMAPHVATRDDKPWTPGDNDSEHRYTVQIATRTGVYYEELILREAGNNQWMRAARVRQGDRTLEEDVDSSWPLDARGQVDWSYVATAPLAASSFWAGHRNWLSAETGLTGLFYVFVTALACAPLVLVWHFWHEAKTLGWAWSSVDSRNMYADAAKTIITAAGIALALLATSGVPAETKRATTELIRFSAKVAAIALITSICSSLALITALLRGHERAKARFIEEQRAAGAISITTEGKLNPTELCLILLSAAIALSSFLVGFIFLGRIASHW